jgi:hypothetical protein
MMKTSTTRKKPPVDKSPTELTAIVILLQEEVKQLKLDLSQKTRELEILTQTVQNLETIRLQPQPQIQSLPQQLVANMQSDSPSQTQETQIQQPSQEWKKVMSKKQSKQTYSAAVKQPQVQPPAKQPKASTSNVQKKFKNLQNLSGEETIKLLLRRQPPKESQPMEISSVMVSLPFTMKARQQPMLAWKASMKALTGHPPLAISLLNPGKAEVFYDTALILSVRESLSAYLLNEAGVQERDLQRRKTMYFKGFFLPLRRAALQGFSIEAQHQLLDLAEKDLPRIPETDKRKQWKFHISKDRSWLQQTSNQTQSSLV